MSITKADAEAADAAARKAADAAGVRIRELAELADLAAACRLFEEIWRPSPGSPPPLQAELLRALTKAGNYASGAYDVASGELVGACMGFFGPPAEASLHSHIAGVLPAGLHRAVGFALKVHQRAWCLHRDTPTMHWTFDPLVRRNAYFNLVKLGARPAEYLPNFYGEMNDSINSSAETDRMLVRWDLLSGRTAAASAGQPWPASAAAELARGAVVALGSGADGWPVAGPFGLGGPEGLPGAARTVLVAVPADIEGMRGTDPRCAATWRTALRGALAPLMERGGCVTGFDRDGWYVVSLDSLEGSRRAAVTGLSGSSEGRGAGAREGAAHSPEATGGAEGSRRAAVTGLSGSSEGRGAGARAVLAQGVPPWNPRAAHSPEATGSREGTQ